MGLGSLLIAGRSWIWPAVALVCVGLALLIWGYRKAPVQGWVRACGLGLKLLGLVALAACLVEPLWTGQRARPGANYFVILADNSQSLRIKDRASPLSRGEQLRRLLVADRNPRWQVILEQHFQVRRYLFDTRLQPATDFTELNFQGRASALGSALRTLTERFKGQPLAGILLLSDGNATDLSEAGLEFNWPPVYPVVLGSDESIRDLAITRVTASQTAFEDAPVTIQAHVTAAGCAGQRVTAQLIELAHPGGSAAQALTNPPAKSAASAGPDRSPGKVVAEQTLRAGAEGQPLVFRFQLRPTRQGLLFYQVRVGLESELDRLDQAAEVTEAVLDNNSRLVVVDRGQGPYRILYVAGRPNWEYRFLNRALAEDPQLELVALIRIAKREPKFQFRGRPGETSNPLFRGFEGQPPEETERYDQPVLLRLNVADPAQLRGGFPKTPEELFGFHAVVLDDLEAEFFSAEQMLLLHRFVAERGGGLLMLGGAESFQQGRFHRTPIGDLLPVYLDPPLPPAPARQWRLALTREGWLTPWVRLRQTEPEELARLAAMPPFQVLNRVRGIKPGASLLATVTDGRGETFPALAVQRFGRGRTAALMIGDLWRWGLRDPALHRDMDKAWRQLFRWLVTDTPERIELQAQPKPAEPNPAVLLQTRARDKQFQPLDNATVTVTIRRLTLASGLTNRPGSVLAPGTDRAATAPDAKPLGPGPERSTPASSTAQVPQPDNPAPAVVRLTSEPSLEEAGLYETLYVVREPGAYQAETVVVDAAGVEVGRAVAGWTSDPAADEFRRLTPNRALLEQLARSTGGQLIKPEGLETFAARLPSLKAPISEAWTVPLWHRAGVFLFALGCFVGEWGLRRLKGLA